MSRKPDFKRALGHGALQAAVILAVGRVMGESPVSDIDATGWIVIAAVWGVTSLVIGGLHYLLDRRRRG